MDDKTKIALCIACTLAEVMKDCKACAFRCGLPARLESLKAQGKAPADINDTASTNERNT